MEILRYVLVDDTGHTLDDEYDDYDQALEDAGDDHAIEQRTYSFSDSELVHTPDGSRDWPPKPDKFYALLADGRHKPLKAADVDGAIREAERLEDVPDQTVDIYDAETGEAVAVSVDLIY